MKILFATSEMAPWVKTGGLGDVAAALPPALRQHHDVRVLLPAYPAVTAAFPAATLLAELPSLAPAFPPCRLLAAESGGLSLLLLDCPEFYQRPGNPYLDAEGHDWADNGLRFALLGRVAARLGQEDSPIGWQADLVNAHDWQAALAAAYLHYQGGCASVVTIHNIAFQGCFSRDLLGPIGLPEHAWRFDGVEYHGQLSFLKAGLQLATLISTVSPTYAREIQHEHFGYGLAPLLRHRAGDLVGILNGVDTGVWNPATDPALASPYAANRLGSKRPNKSALQQEMGLPERDDRPLLGVVSRLSHQKGLDLLHLVGEGLPHLPAQLVVLGSGDKALEAGFRELAARYPQDIAVRIGFDEGLAHRIEAGADVFVMPSRFEPCGLNQMYSLRYGTPPLVRATGGLADSVVDCSEATLADKTANGFVCHGDDAHSLWQTLERTCRTWQDRRTWLRLQQNGMRCDFSWHHAAKDYDSLFDAARTRHSV
ncbi:MAG: hypothetical protein RIR00_458 [Pseudomonadota bacterium]|jgi:starch synthase